MTQSKQKQTVILTKQFQKELKKMPDKAVRKLFSLLRLLQIEGKLEPPEAKKLSGYQNLFEIRIKQEQNWRVFYCYTDSGIVILSCFSKKNSKDTAKRDKKSSKKVKLLNGGKK